MEREIEKLVPDFPYGEAFWAFLILRCRNRKDIPRDVLHESLLNDDCNEDVDYDRDPVDPGISYVPVDCFNGIYCNWVPVREDLSLLVEWYEEDEGLDCKFRDDCPLYAQDECTGMVETPESLTQSDLTSWLAWDILVKLSGATTCETYWQKKGYKRTARRCRYEIPEPYRDQVDVISLVHEVMRRFDLICDYVELLAPEVGDPQESRGRTVVPVTLQVRLKEEGFDALLEVLSAQGIDTAPFPEGEIPQGPAPVGAPRVNPPSAQPPHKPSKAHASSTCSPSCCSSVSSSLSSNAPESSGEGNARRPRPAHSLPATQGGLALEGSEARPSCI